MHFLFGFFLILFVHSKIWINFKIYIKYLEIKKLDLLFLMNKLINERIIERLKFKVINFLNLFISIYVMNIFIPY